MKKILLFTVISLLVTGCKYFEEKRLFSKKVDTLINYADAIDESMDTLSIDTVEVLDMDIPESDITSDSQTSVYNQGYYHSDYKYHVVAGCFMIPEYAERYAEKLRTMGYKTEIVLRDDGFHMVSALSSNDKSASKSGLRSVRAELTPKAWIYEFK